MRNCRFLACAQKLLFAWWWMTFAQLNIKAAKLTNAGFERSITPCFNVISFLYARQPFSRQKKHLPVKIVYILFLWTKSGFSFFLHLPTFSRRVNPFYFHICLISSIALLIKFSLFYSLFSICHILVVHFRFSSSSAIERVRLHSRLSSKNSFFFFWAVLCLLLYFLCVCAGGGVFHIGGGPFCLFLLSSIAENALHPC